MRKPKMCAECGDPVPPEDCLIGEGEEFCYACHLESLQNSSPENLGTKQ